MVFFQWVEGHKLVLHSTHFWNVRVGLRRRGSSLSWKILLVSSGTAAPLRGVKKTHFKIVFCDCLQGKRGHNFLHHRHNLHLAYVWRRCGLTGWIEISKRGFFGGMTSSDLEFNLSHSSCYPECAIQGTQLPPTVSLQFRISASHTPTLVLPTQISIKHRRVWQAHTSQAGITSRFNEWESRPGVRYSSSVGCTEQPPSAMCGVSTFIVVL